MKILEVTHGFPPDQTGGTENCTYLLSKALVKNKDSTVYVFSGGLPSNYSPDFKDEVINYIYLRRIHSISLSCFKQKFPDVEVSTYKNNYIEKVFEDYLDKIQPDVVHFQHTIGLSSSLIHVALERNLKPIVTIRDFWYLCPRIKLLTFYEHVCRGPEYGLNCYYCHQVKKSQTQKLLISKKMQIIISAKVPSFIKRYIKDKMSTKKHYNFVKEARDILPFLIRYQYITETLKSASYVISPSNFLKYFYVEKIGIRPSKIIVIPHGIIPFKTEKRKISIGKTIYFGFLGPPRREKGAHLLLEAFKKMPLQKAKLIIWGRDWQKISKQIESSKNIILKGEYSSEDLGEVFSSFDVLIIPSIWEETFSFVAHEAFAAKTPVIASDIGVFNEIIQDGENGLLFKVNDARSLYNCIMKIIEKTELIDKFTQNIKEPKPWNEYANELYNLYKEASKIT
ncbi:glycosyltransferase family 4 protein [candidate division WOR-3 bacterium]|nr:glycosyltransferase family 4 protein [candidate division WOR-3 bacterium]